MRIYLLAALLGGAVIYTVWTQFGAYAERARSDAKNADDRRTRISELSADGCDGVVATLATLEHQLLKAGGIEVPRPLADDIELCLEENIMSVRSRQSMEDTRLIRLFPIQR